MHCQLRLTLFPVFILNIYHYLLLKKSLDKTQRSRAESTDSHENWIQLFMASEFERSCEHEKSEEAEEKFQNEESDFPPAFEEMVVGPFFCLDVGFSCICLSF